MKIKHLHLLKMLAIAASMTALSHAATVEVEWPDEWTDAPTTVWDCPSTTGYIASSYSSAYYTNDEGKKSIAAQYNVGTGSFVFPTEMYKGSDISIDGDIWLIMADGVLGNVASAKTEGNVSSSDATISYDNITVVGGDANFYYTGDVSTALVMGAGLVLAGTNNLSGAGEHSIDITYQNNVAGTARIYVDENATVSSIIGGGYLYQSTSLDGSSGGTFTGSIVTESTAGATEISIAGGTVEGNIYGGGYVSTISVTGNESGSVTVTTNANILGDTSISISDGTVGSGSSIILGGGMISSAAAGATAQVLSNTQIDISGGTINAYIYGGGSNSGDVGNADVEGNTYINISGGTITGNVTASGLNYSDTYGDATITVTGSAVINGDFVAETPTSNVQGTTKLQLGTSESAYNQTIQNAYNFDILDVAAGSNVTVAGIISNVSLVSVNGTLNLTGSTNASAISIAESAALNIAVSGENYSTLFSSSELSWSNSGNLNISVSDGVSDGTVYYIFNDEANITDYGKITGYGGTVSGNTFTVGTSSSLVLDGTQSETVSASGTLNISTAGATSIDDPSIVMQFNSSGDITVNSVTTVADTATDNTGPSFISYVTSEVDSDTLIAAAAYEFNLTLGANDSVLISLYVGSDDYDVSQFLVYHKSSDGEWETITPTDLTYSDGYLSFVVDSFSTYGYSVSNTATFDGVPEPSTATLSLMALAGLLMRRRRKN